MSIVIKEVFNSDTINDLVNKINFNFDQLLISGGGPVGPQGNVGPIGPGGPLGRRGENIYWDDGTGLSSAPLVGIFTGDQFVLANGDVYEWDGFSWVVTGTNIRGPQGLQGLTGASTNILRFLGNANSSFGITSGWYPQLVNQPTPSGDIDYITLQQGGLDILYLGNNEDAYGISGANSGISNFPSKNNSSKLWVIQNSLVGGGQNGITLGAIGAKETTDDPSTKANYKQFGHIFLDAIGNMNIRITSGGVSTEPKAINITTDKYVSIQAGDILNNNFSVGKDPFDSLIGIFGILKDKVDLETENYYLKAKTNLNVVLDSDGGSTGVSTFTKTNIPIVNPTVKERIVTILPTLSISNDTTHYSEGVSIKSGTSSAKFELFLFGSKTIATIGAQSGNTIEGKNLMVMSNGKVLISPTSVYPLTPISTWINSAVNDGMVDGSLSVYGKIRMNNTNAPIASLIYSDSTGVFGYANSSGIPGNNTNFVIGLWGRQVAQNRVYLFQPDHYVNIGDNYANDGLSGLVLYKDEFSSSRIPHILLKTDLSAERPKIVLDNTFKSTIIQSTSINTSREYQLPRSAGLGGVIMTMTDNNSQFNDSWEEYQKMAGSPIAHGFFKNQISLSAFGANTGGYITNGAELAKIPVSSGMDFFTVGVDIWKEKRFPSKIHLKRINRDFWFIKFTITVFVDPNEISGLSYDNFRFFEFTFNGTLPGQLQTMRNDIIAGVDDEGGVWYSGGGYQSGIDLSVNGTPSVSTRMNAVVDGTSFGKLMNLTTDIYQTQWTIQRNGTNNSKIQIVVEEPINKNTLRSGVTFTGNAIVYGTRTT